MTPGRPTTGWRSCVERGRASKGAVIGPNANQVFLDALFRRAYNSSE